MPTKPDKLPAQLPLALKVTRTHTEQWSCCLCGIHNLMLQTLHAELCLWLIAWSFSSFSRLSWVFVKRCKYYRFSAPQESKIRKETETETKQIKRISRLTFFQHFQFSSCLPQFRCWIFESSLQIDRTFCNAQWSETFSFFYSLAGRWKKCKGVEIKREIKREWSVLFFAKHTVLFASALSSARISWIEKNHLSWPLAFN